MCFTVAIVRNNTLLTTQKYYDSLPHDWSIEKNIPEIPDFYMISGFEFPKLPVVTNKGVSLMQWGLIPSWTPDTASAMKIRTQTLNARGETVFEKAAFRKSIASKRCILPVTGFFEWRECNKLKYPYYVIPSDENGFSIGSIYDNWVDQETGEIFETFSIVTTEANDLMAKIHNTKKRMPLLLSQENANRWLNSSQTNQDIRKVIQPYPDTKMKAYTISRNANHTHINRNVPSIVNEVKYPEIEWMNNTLF